MTRGADLHFLHIGAFSGSAPSLRDALARRLVVQAVDLMPSARRAALVPGRLRAMAEARASGTRAVPWTKTAAWSRALQRDLERRGLLDPGVPTLVVQTLSALAMPVGSRYAVYTDRVGAEALTAPGPHASLATPGWRKREAAFLRGADHVLVMGASSRDCLVGDYGLDPGRVHVVGAGPNMALGDPVPPRARGRRLLFVGIDWERKGGPTLLEAFPAVRRRFPDATLTIAGASPGGPLPDGVVVRGRVPHQQVPGLYDDADLLVIPTHFEAYGIALVEALQKGLPCVGTSVGNQPAIIGDAGVAVTPGDPEALSRALCDVLAGYPAYQQRATRRGAALRETETWEHVAGEVCRHLGLGSGVSA